MILEEKKITYKNRVVFERFVFAISNIKRVPKVFYDNEACFLFLTKGAFQFRTPIELMHFAEGEGMLAQCGNYLMEPISEKPKEANDTVSVIGAFFYPEIVKNFFMDDLILKPFQEPIKVSKVTIEPMLKSFVEGLHYLLDNPSLVDENLILTKQKELLIVLSKSEQAKSVNDLVNSLFSPNTYDFKKVVAKNLYSDLTIPELAYLAGMSPATFKRHFKELFEQSPARYILKKKLDRSLKLLKVKSKPVSEIAYDCGFNSASSFNKTFKKHLGITPTEFREREKGKSLSQMEN